MKFFDPSATVPRNDEGGDSAYEIVDERVVRHHRKAGYMVVERKYRNKKNRSDTWSLKSAVTPEGHYIGSPKTAHHLCVVRGIKPELVSDDLKVCTIGRDKRGKWWGWSHRAMGSFKPGSKVRQGDVIERQFGVGAEATSDDEAREMAVAFAGEVG